MRLEGKRAVVTGAAGGIGRAICERFSAEGAWVAAIDVARSAVGDVRLECDLADDDAFEATAATIFQSGAPDIVVHAAAICPRGGTVETSPSLFREIFDLNVGGAVRLARAFAASMSNRRSGSIVLISSINAIFATPTLSAYAASKGALNSLTRTLALELAPSGVRVNAVAPASIDTPMLQASFAAEPSPADARAANIARHPLGRLGTPVDVANLVLFLSSDEASWMTGCIVPIDGGAGITRR